MSERAIQKSELITDLAFPGFQLFPMGLVVSGEPTQADWQRCWLGLNKMNRCIHWWIGDFLNLYEQAWGKMYEQAMQETGFEYQTLINDRNVAAKVEFNRRRLKLPSHLSPLPAAARNRHSMARRPHRPPERARQPPRSGPEAPTARARSRRAIAPDNAPGMATGAPHSSASARGAG